MNVYIFQADLYCVDCAAVIVDAFHNGKRLDTGDSNDYPQGPYVDGGGEADCPYHCGDCGVFLENPLTDYGEEYVRENSDTMPEWRKFYHWLF